jgi:hypothetical protein
MTRKSTRFGAGAVLAFLILTLTARADTSLTVGMGWEGIYRAGHWTPIYITVSDPSTRQVDLEVSAPHDGIFSMQIRQSFTIGPQERTFPVYAPTTYDLEQLTVTIRDSKTRKLLARYVREYGDQPIFLQGQPIRPNDTLIGVSGRKSTLSVLRRPAGGNNNVYVGYLPPLLLPAVACGYETLDVLVLSQPDLSRLEPEQQQAIADWVRAGGSLLMWPSDGPQPQSGALLPVLPCRIGDTQSLSIPPATLKKYKLADRFKQVRSRQLVPAEDAKAFPLFEQDKEIVGYGRNVGFGRAVVLPIDPSEFFFDRSPSADRFWKAILAQARVKIKDDTENDNNNNVNYGYWGDDYRTTNAVRSNIELMGSIPGVGSFDFTYVAIVLIGLMLIVGPIDWMVLKRLGRQPWTWATTTGWIALITIGAIYIGYLFKSGELHYRTLQVIDQADGRAVATTDLVCIYSPKSQIYNLSGDRDVWWQPVGDMMYYRSGAMHTDLPFHQDYEGNRPLGVAIPVWNLRFMRGDTFATAPAVVDAELKVGSKRLTGTITNHADAPLEQIRIQGRSGVYTAGDLVIAPGETKTIDIGLEKPGTTFTTQPVNQPNGYYGYGYYGDVGPVNESRLYATVCDLSSNRADAVKEVVDSGKQLCIYARMQDPKPTVTLEDAPQAIEKHWQVVRALVPVK